MDPLELLLGTLEDLTEKELKKFQLYLTDGALEGFERIPKGKLEKCDSTDTAGIMRKTYGSDGALRTTRLILRKMKRNDLADSLEREMVKSSGSREVAKRDQGSAWTQGFRARRLATLSRCFLTLDTNTAHRRLLLSEGNRKVTGVKKEQPYPDHPDRFDDNTGQVLSREPLIGRCYWEVEWSGDGSERNGATVGVAYKSISRSEWMEHSAKAWSLECTDDGGVQYIAWHNKIKTHLPAPPSGSRRVGVCLDREAGTVSFYSVSSDTQTLMHTYKITHTKEPLYAAINVWIGSSASLI